MIYEKDIQIGEHTVHVVLKRPTKERFQTLADDTKARYFCLLAFASVGKMEAPPMSVTIPRDITANSVDALQNAADRAMQKAAERCALLAGATSDIMELPEG